MRAFTNKCWRKINISNAINNGSLERAPRRWERKRGRTRRNEEERVRKMNFDLFWKFRIVGDAIWRRSFRLVYTPRRALVCVSVNIDCVLYLDHTDYLMINKWNGHSGTMWFVSLTRSVEKSTHTHTQQNMSPIDTRAMADTQCSGDGWFTSITNQSRADRVKGINRFEKKSACVFTCDSDCIRLKRRASNIASLDSRNQNDKRHTRMMNRARTIDTAR